MRLVIAGGTRSGLNERLMGASLHSLLSPQGKCLLVYDSISQSKRLICVYNQWYAYLIFFHCIFIMMCTKAAPWTNNILSWRWQLCCQSQVLCVWCTVRTHRTKPGVCCKSQARSRGSSCSKDPNSPAVSREEFLKANFLERTNKCMSFFWRLVVWSQGDV